MIENLFSDTDTETTNQKGKLKFIKPCFINDNKKDKQSCKVFTDTHTQK